MCNFEEFRIYDFDQDITQPQDTLTLDELPTRSGPLDFLWPTNEPARFKIDREKVTREAADVLATVYRSLAGKRHIGKVTAQRFALQSLVCLFSEDIGLLPKHFFTDLLNECVDPPKAFDLFDGLFRAMNAPERVRGGRYAKVDYFNGGLFAESAAVELDPHHEVALLKKAATYNWSHVSPDIFGTIFQHAMDESERHAFGAHYTAQADIMRIVKPTIVDPFMAALAKAETLKDLVALRNQLQSIRVLDPACGSGNFLYIAYREMRRIEVSIAAKENLLSKRDDPRQASLVGVSPRQFFGLDVLPFAVELAKVTLAIAPKLASDELHTVERVLPLANLDQNIQCRDALLDEKGTRALWPAADIIIGNPPFLGAKRLKPERGTDYINTLRKQYPEVPGMADYCVYWFRRAHDHLNPCTIAAPFTGRAGLVGTQNIRNNHSRVGGLDHIVGSGTIIEAVENMPWSGEANVHVSIANWVKNDPKSKDTKAGEVARFVPAARRLWTKVELTPELFKTAKSATRPRTVTTGKRGKIRKDKSFELAPRDASIISPSLSDEVDTSGALVLEYSSRESWCYTGQYPRHEGFMLTVAAARELLSSQSRNRDVVHPFLVGREMLSGQLQCNRYVIDFQTMDVLKARSYSDAFAILEKNVLPYVRFKAAAERQKSELETGQEQSWLRTWWQHFRPRPELIGKISKLNRYAVCSRVTKRPIFVFLSSKIRPGDALSCFTLNDDFSFGILQSDAHWQWFIAKCSKLTERFRYTPESVFDTFPWPQSPTKPQIRAVAKAAREIRAIRDRALPSTKGGLRSLYRTLELPGKNPLKDAHAALDEAVLTAYGFSAKKDILQQLLDLNLEVAAAIKKGDAVTAPGVPPSYGNPADLITEDSIQP